MYHSYVIINHHGTLYKGSTSNLETRLQQHNEGASRYTRGKGPWTLLISEGFKTRKEAMARESYYKTGSGRDYIKNFIRNSPSRKN